MSSTTQLFATITALTEAVHLMTEYAKRGDKSPGLGLIRPAETPTQPAEIQEPPVEGGMKNSDMAKNLFRANPAGLTCTQASNYLERHITTRSGKNLRKAANSVVNSLLRTGFLVRQGDVYRIKDGVK
jgi:hypothetical protein